MLPTYSFTNYIYIYIYIYIYKQALNSHQGLICHKIQPIKTNQNQKNFMHKLPAQGEDIMLLKLKKNCFD